MAILTIISLGWTILFFENSPFIWAGDFNNSIQIMNVDNNISIPDKYLNIWAVRGQIGDILSGHFSALAFFAIAISIYFQSEANKKIQESIEKQDDSLNLQSTSIDQQNEALRLQSQALKEQTQELRDSREESSKQTEEFYINNMNIKLDRYYKILDKNLGTVNSNLIESYKRYKSNPENSNDISRIINENEKNINKTIQILNFIYEEISTLEGQYDMAYNTYREELKLRLLTNDTFESINELDSRYSEINTCLAFELL